MRCVRCLVLLRSRVILGGGWRVDNLIQISGNTTTQQQQQQSQQQPVRWPLLVVQWFTGLVHATLGSCFGVVEKDSECTLVLLYTITTDTCICCDVMVVSMRDDANGPE
jgi:FtsH-binding integral membrane protein